MKKNSKRRTQVVRRRQHHPYELPLHLADETTEMRSHMDDDDNDNEDDHDHDHDHDTNDDMMSSVDDSSHAASMSMSMSVPETGDPRLHHPHLDHSHPPPNGTSVIIVNHNHDDDDDDDEEEEEEEEHHHHHHHHHNNNNNSNNNNNNNNNNSNHNMAEVEETAAQQQGHQEEDENLQTNPSPDHTATTSNMAMRMTTPSPSPPPLTTTNTTRRRTGGGASTPQGPSTRRSTTRRVLQAAGRPLRRLVVGRNKAGSATVPQQPQHQQHQEQAPESQSQQTQQQQTQPPQAPPRTKAFPSILGGPRNRQPRQTQAQPRRKGPAAAASAARAPYGSMTIVGDATLRGALDPPNPHHHHHTPPQPHHTHHPQLLSVSKVGSGEVVSSLAGTSSQRSLTASVVTAGPQGELHLVAPVPSRASSRATPPPNLLITPADQQPNSKTAANSNSVHVFEQWLRQLLLLLVAYLLGVAKPQWRDISIKALEYVSVAWATCLAILLLAWMQFQKNAKLVVDEDQQARDGEMAPLLVDLEEQDMMRHSERFPGQQLHARDRDRDRDLIFQEEYDDEFEGYDDADYRVEEDLGHETPEMEVLVIRGTKPEQNGPIPPPPQTPQQVPQATVPEGDGGNEDPLRPNDEEAATTADAEPENTAEKEDPIVDNDFVEIAKSPGGETKENPIRETKESPSSPPADHTNWDSGAEADAEPESARKKKRVLPMEQKEKEQHLSTVSDHQEPSAMPHPALEHFFVVDTFHNERALPNLVNRAFPISSDLYEGHMIVLIRTPDVEKQNKKADRPENESAVNYFRGKQRRFEFQFQVRLKKAPSSGTIYFACELNESIKMGMIQRAFVSAAMAFMKKMNSTFHYSITGTPAANSKSATDGSAYWEEKPHMAFTVEGSMDRLVVTPPGQEPPKLGGIIHEDPALVKKRQKGQSTIVWNTHDTYTLALWSAYVDFLDWKCLNLPGIRPFSLSSIISTQPIYLTMYSIKNDGGSDGSGGKHKKADMNILGEFELSNRKCSQLGEAAEQWLENHELRAAKAAAATAGAAAAAPQKKIPSERHVKLDEEREEEHDEDQEDEGEEEQDEEQDDEDDMEEVRTTPSRITLEAETDENIPEEDEDDEDDVEEEATVAELGQGLYLKSGDAVILQESASTDSSAPDSSPGIVANGGGFAVLQEGSSSVILIEKIERRRLRRRRRRSASATSRLLHTGDTVRLKLITANSRDAKFLSIHRGWWLKWVSDAPTKNGYFTIHTNETEVSDGKALSTTQNSFLTYGGSFSLKHKRWDGYEVGASTQESTTYGGRMLGLYKSKDKQGTNRTPTEVAIGQELRNPDTDDEEGGQTASVAETDVNAGREGVWMGPLQLTACLPRPSETQSPVRTPSIARPPGFDPLSQLAISSLEQNLRLDVPVWIELMNRSERRRQLAYVVRVVLEAGIVEEETKEPDQLEAPPKKPMAFLRLRTGQDLAGIMQVGMVDDDLNSETGVGGVGPAPHKNRHRRLSTTESGVSAFSDAAPKRQLEFSDGDLRSRSADDVLPRDPDSRPPAPPFSPRSSFDVDSQEGESDGLDDIFSDEGLELDDDDITEDLGEQTGTRTAPRRGRKIMGQIAKSVKSGTVTTGKHVLKQSKKAGKAIVAPISTRTRPKRPPGFKEPKTLKVKTPARTQIRRKDERDHHVLLNRTMKRMEKRTTQRWLDIPSVLAGQLSGPDQSCRAASSVLQRMSLNAASGVGQQKLGSILAAQVTYVSDLDRWFLHGGAAQLGVVPLTSNTLLHDCVVARCLWESHWREEWCGIFGDEVCFFEPLTKRASLQLGRRDIRSCRCLDIAEMSPLPGFPILVIETPWQCYYIAFFDSDSRHLFLEKLNKMKTEQNGIGGDNTVIPDKLLSKARFWQGFQDSVEAAASGGKRKWAKIPSGTKMLDRTVLNGRRMSFDVETNNSNDEFSEGSRAEQLSIEILERSLAVTSKSLEANPDAFVRFLDMTTKLRSISLSRINLSRPEALCFFTNIYHCLLQHSLLLTINGPLNKRSAGHYMRSTCYEIGGDVFSLAELYQCVIRGKLCRPTLPMGKSPYVEASRKSGAYRFYALDCADARMNFILNTGDATCLQVVKPLRSRNLDQQIDELTRSAIRRHFVVDVPRRAISLPRVCDVYRMDFGNGEPMEALQFCMNRSDESRQRDAGELINDEQLTIKFQPVSDIFHPCLRPSNLMTKKLESSSDLSNV